MMIHRYLRGAAASAALLAGLALSAPAHAVQLPVLPEQARVPADVADAGRPDDLPGDMSADAADAIVALIESGLRGKELVDAIRLALDDSDLAALVAAIPAELPELPDEARVPSDLGKPADLPGKPADIEKPTDLPDGADADHAGDVLDTVDGELKGKDLGAALRGLLQPTELETLVAAAAVELPDQANVPELPDAANVPADPGRPADRPEAMNDIGISIRAMVETGLRGRELADAVRMMIADAADATESLTIAMHAELPEAAQMPELPEQANVPANPGKPMDLPEQTARGAAAKGFVDEGLRGRELADAVRGFDGGETESLVASLNVELPEHAHTPDLPDQANVPANPGKPADLPGNPDDAGKPIELPDAADRGAAVKGLVDSGMRGQDLANEVRALNGSDSAGSAESLVASLNAELPEQARVPVNPGTPGKPADAGQPTDLPEQTGRGAAAKSLVEEGARGQDLADAVRPAPANDAPSESLVVASAVTPSLPDLPSLPESANVPTELGAPGKPADLPGKPADAGKPSDVPAGSKPAGVPVEPTRPVETPVSETPVSPSRPVTPPVVSTPRDESIESVVALGAPVAPERPVTPPVVDTPVAPTRPVETPVADTPVEPVRPVTAPVVDTPVVPTRPVATPPVDKPVVPTLPTIPTAPVVDADDHAVDHANDAAFGHVTINEEIDPTSGRGHKHDDYISWDANPTTNEVVDVTVFIDNANGLLSGSMVDRVYDAVTNINSHSLLNIILTEDGGADYQVRFSMDDSASGNVLGQTTFSYFSQPVGTTADGTHLFNFAGEDVNGGNAEVTMFSGWNWFDGSGTDIAGNEIDFLSVTTHELLHVVGLAHDDLRYLADALLDDNTGHYSVMASSLGYGMQRRALSAEDILSLGILYGPGQGIGSGDGGDGGSTGGPPSGRGPKNRSIVDGGVHGQTVIPEPTGGLLMLGGLGVMAMRRRRTA